MKEKKEKSVTSKHEYKAFHGFVPAKLGNGGSLVLGI